MKEIKLTRGMVALVDDDDYEWISQWEWIVRERKEGLYYALRYDMINRKRVLMHRIIMNTPPYMQVDHIDHNGLNNQKDNLRNCSHAENMCNRRSSGGSRYLGVCQHRVSANGKVYLYFQAYIQADNKNMYIGSFSTEDEAAIAYNEAAHKYHGEFANLNIVN